MIYEHSIEHSLQVMRDAMPWMTRQAAGAQPVSYAVWYAYVSGENPSLNHAIDQYLLSHPALDEAATLSFFERYVAEVDVKEVQGATDRAAQVLGIAADSAAAMGDQAQRYRQLLEAVATRWVTAPSRADLSSLMAQTQLTASAVGLLQEQLATTTREVTLLRAEVQRARRDSLQDHLSGIANRRAYEQKLMAAISLAELSDIGTPLCLMLGDIDHFKRINDAHGHEPGDQVIRSVAQTLQRLAPSRCLAARVGGEEFGLLLPSTSIKEAIALAHMWRTHVSAEPIALGQGERARVTLSIGVVRWKRGDTPVTLRERADQALYGAKHAGRDCVIALEN